LGKTLDDIDVSGPGKNNFGYCYWLFLKIIMFPW
jgi:hypothetical protein